MFFSRLKNIEDLLWQLSDRLWEIESDIDKIKRSLPDENKGRVLERSERDRKYNEPKRNTKKEFTIWA